MRNKEIEKRINTIVKKSVPDVQNNILKRCEEKKGYVRNMNDIKSDGKVKYKISKKIIGAFAIIMICLCGIVGINQYDNYYKVDTTIEFDVNPSIEIQVNKKEKVIDIIALNDDGKRIIEGMNLKNTDLEVATNALIGSMLKNGYITEAANSILVSVKNANKEKSAKLQEEISNDINELLKASSIEGAILVQEYDDNNEVKKIAEETKLSEGKIKLINKILEKKIKDINGKELTFDMLSKMSINELNVLLETKNAKIENVKTTGKASKTAYIGEEKAKKIAYNNANVSSKKVGKAVVELDCDDGVMVYDVEFNVGRTEYDYEINAKTGKIIDKEVEKDENEEDRDDDNKKTTSKSTNKSENTTTAYISVAKAKAIAYKNAGISSSSASKVKVELDNEDGKKVYEVEFYVAKTKTEYSYEIDAKTGKILDKDIDKENDD